MNIFKLIVLAFGLFVLSCNSRANKNNSVANGSATDTLRDKEEIRNLIRQVLSWSDSKNTIEVLPYLIDNKDSTCSGFDLDKLKSNLDQLRRTNFFAEEFIQNYNQIIQTLDRKIKNNEFEKWHPYGELPTFIFANDINPWCECQDNMDWNLVEVKIISLSNDKGELDWYWDNLSSDTDKSWKEFNSHFRVAKESGKWKIAYMHGFDFKESTRKDGL